jgi:flagellin
MSDIVLSASVRQNLLSLQSTANLLSTTQNRLATGNKVNSALDNPTNFFTSQSLNSRASDISNLLDGIGNGVQVLQQANNGITSLQKLVDSAKSIANQALQTTVGYSTKSNVSTTIGGASATDLRGTTAFTNATASTNVLFDGTAGGVTKATAATKLDGTLGSYANAVAVKASDTTTNLAGTATLIGVAGATTIGTATLAGQPADGDTLTVNGKTITFKAGAAPTATTVPSGFGVLGNIATDGTGNSIVYLGTSGTPAANVNDVLQAIDVASGVQTGTVTNGVAAFATNAGQTVSSIAAGITTLKSSTGADLSVTGKADFLKAIGLSTATGSGPATLTVARTTAATQLGNLITDGSTLNVNGKTITFKNAAVPTASASHTGITGKVETDGMGNSTVYLQGSTIADVLKAVDIATGVQTATLAAGGATLATAAGATNSSVAATGALQISTGLGADLSISGTGNAIASLGLGGNTGTNTTFSAARGQSAGGVNGKTMTFSAFNGGLAVNVTFGDGTNGTVKTLDQLNNALSANNMTAAIDTNGKLTISAANDYASSTLGSIKSGGVMGGTISSGLTFTAAAAPIQDASAQTTRAGLVTQYNNIIQQITTTSQDASFNGVNLLGGDQLKLTFNETGKSTLNITGVTFDPTGLGLSALSAGTDFIDNNATNKVLNALNTTSATLRAQGSSLGSNLSIVQIRQDFSKNLINTLQTGASNLTLADTNQEAANSQALATRQSIAVSALALANTSQQSVLRLLQ